MLPVIGMQRGRPVNNRRRVRRDLWLCVPIRPAPHLLPPGSRRLRNRQRYKAIRAGAVRICNVLEKPAAIIPIVVAVWITVEIFLAIAGGS
jgi:hypothetical protein